MKKCAFIRRGKPAEAPVLGGPLDRITARLKRTYATTETEQPQLKKTKVEVEEFLNSTELADADLVEFWSRDESDSEGIFSGTETSLKENRCTAKMTDTEERIVDLAYVILTAEIPCKEESAETQDSNKRPCQVSDSSAEQQQQPNKKRLAECPIVGPVGQGLQHQSTKKRPQPPACKVVPKKKLRKPG